MTPAEVIAEVRRLVQDQIAPLRYSDTDLLGYFNQTVRRILTIRPDLFITSATVPLTAGSVLQSLPADAHRLVDVYYVENYNSVTEVDRLYLERGHPQWVSDPAGVPLNFARHARNPTKFFVYPRPVANLSVFVEYVAVPPIYAINDTVTAPDDGYFTTLVDGVVFLASSIDDEHVESGRAKLFMDAFMQGLGTDLQSRAVTDEDKPVISGGQR